jgi:hypothetical protein
MFGLIPLTTDHADRFPSGWGWFCPYQPHRGYKRNKTSKKITINFSCGHPLPLKQEQTQGILPSKRKTVATLALIIPRIRALMRRPRTSPISAYLLIGLELNRQLGAHSKMAHT